MTGLAAIDIQEALSARNWTVRRKQPPGLALPEHIASRYPRLPADVSNFICAVAECRNAAGDAWLFGYDDYEVGDAEAFKWNEVELMSLGAADGDAERERIEAFWNAHFPFALAVHSDYDYLAVSVDEAHYGAVVHGFAPEFESCEVIAPSFSYLLAELASQAARATPEWPYNLFL